MAILWSDDCLRCLCGLPHTQKEHEQALYLAWQEKLERMDDNDDLDDMVSVSKPYRRFIEPPRTLHD